MTVAFLHYLGIIRSTRLRTVVNREGGTVVRAEFRGNATGRWEPDELRGASNLTNQAADGPHLVVMVQQVEENVGRQAEELSADAAYYSDHNLKWLEEKKVEAFISPEKVRHSEWRAMKYPRGRIPKNADREYLMRRKLRTKRGRERYKKRQCSVEPVFGHVKEAMGFRQLLLRGESKTRCMWQFACAAYNLSKIFRKTGSLVAIQAT